MGNRPAAAAGEGLAMRDHPHAPFSTAIARTRAGAVVAGPQRALRRARGIFSFMEVTGVVEHGRIVLPPSVHLQEGARVRVIVDPESQVRGSYEREPVSEEAVLADIARATGRRFAP